MNLERVETILKLLHGQAHVGEIDVEGSGWRFKARKGKSAPVLTEVDSPPLMDEPAAPVHTSVRAGMVGVYRSPKSPLRVGEHVQSGASVGNIDSMRILNPVTAESTGYVVNVLVEDGDPVEFGQELFVLSSDLVSEPGER